MIKGKLVYLSAVERQDLEQFRDWRNNEDFRKYFREYREINTDMQEKWFKDKVMNDMSTMMFSIKRVSDDKLLGCCGLCYINWIHRNADLSLYIGNDESYIDEEGYALESCLLLFKHAFYQLGLNKIWTEIYEFDEQKKKLYTNIGLKIDGILREDYFYNGQWWNTIILSIIKKDFESNGGI